MEVDERDLQRRTNEERRLRRDDQRRRARGRSSLARRTSCPRHQRSCGHFVHDQQTGTTEQASIDSSGGSANDVSYRAMVSADGRFVSLDSKASNVVPDDTNPAIDVFVHDRQAGAPGPPLMNSFAPTSGITGNFVDTVRSPRLTPTSVPVRVARSSPVGLRVRRTWRFCGARRSTPSLSERGPCATGGCRWQTPCLPCDPNGNRWQRFRAKSSRFGASGESNVCDRLRPLCSITVPSQ